MTLRIHPALPQAFLVVWLITCVLAIFFASSPVVFGFAYFVLPFSAFIVPLCLAYVTCQLAGLNEVSTTVRPMSIGLSIAAAVVGVVAYGLSFSVVSRFLELPWRAGKFGETSLSLGKSAAEFFGLASILVVLSAVALLRAAPSKSRYTAYAVGSIGMVIVASLVYLLFGLSPLVQWRA